MKEDLTSFETAKLAKEKGFPQNLTNTSWYNELGNLGGRTDLNKEGKSYNEVYNSYSVFIPTEHKDEFKIDSYSAPTQSVLQKWLIEKYNVHVWYQPHTDSMIKLLKDKYNKDAVYGVNVTADNKLHKVFSGMNLYDLTEGGLQEALKLIEYGRTINFI